MEDVKAEKLEDPKDAVNDFLFTTFLFTYQLITDRLGAFWEKAYVGNPS